MTSIKLKSQQPALNELKSQIILVNIFLHQKESLILQKQDMSDFYQLL